MKETETSVAKKPVKLSEEIKLILDYLKSNEARIDKSPLADSLKKAIKKIEKNYIDAGSLIKISEFAVLYGERYKGGAMTKQAIYLMIKTGRLELIEIDGMKFVHRSALDE